METFIIFLRPGRGILDREEEAGIVKLSSDCCIINSSFFRIINFSFKPDIIRVNDELTDYYNLS